MKIFITGTDTNIGKTLVSSWLCLHTGYEYFKPISSGDEVESDSQVVHRLSGAKIHPEIYKFKSPVSPHLAATLENKRINTAKIVLPESKNLIVEGAGGLMVPLNESELLIDIIKIPTILVASSRLGTINHTLLSLEVMRARNIDVLGVIMCGAHNKENREAIEFYGKIKVLGELPITEVLSDVPFTQELKEIML